MTTLKRHGRQGWAVSVDGVSIVGLTRTEAVELIAVGDVARITSPRPGLDDSTVGDDADDQGQP